MGRNGAACHPAAHLAVLTRYALSARGLSELQLPGLAHQVLAEACMRLAVDELEARSLVDVAGGAEHAVSPERDLAVAGRARKLHAFIDQPRADAEPPRLRVPQEQAQPRDPLRFLHPQDPAALLPLPLGGPAAPPPW